jgi:CDP-paratose 2-epimerase
VEDLVDALFAFSASINQLAGQAFNIGGGPANAISLLELLQLIKELNGALPLLAFEDWRPGDQRYYVSDTSKFGEATGWRPKVSATEGIERLYRWLEGIGKAEKFVQAVAL